MWGFPALYSGVKKKALEKAGHAQIILPVTHVQWSDPPEM
jgi:hypothetical protein